ncbi:alanine racemase [Microlunatus flavus]|uniref:Alanine racemase n=1 Tax=Microlunatus flavus TaxID=1036181 RepID=A0A1H9MD80_9ACTN|nr:alanine racemase [Microlunatus flavus]SER21415.1 alanine racemase [Microlunatus flavus]
MTPTTAPDASAPSAIDPATASAEIDLAALRDNVAALAAHVGPAALMVVVKADAYGHGMAVCAREARAAGATWLGVATPGEALALRAVGDTGPLLCWLYGPTEDLSPLVAADVDVSASSAEDISRLAAGAAVAERVARVHLKVDTGLTRNGAPEHAWDELFAAAVEAEGAGALRTVGLWSHLAAADEPGHPSVGLQLAAFDRAYVRARLAGLQPELRHLANSAGALVVPEARFDLVRVGIAAYGVEPAPGLAALAGVTLTPVMRLRAQLALVKRVAAGTGVSYGWTWTAPSDTVVGLVPLGYADGVPRHAGNVAEVAVGGRRAPVRGRICMDQLVVELGPDAREEPGDEVTLFGGGPEAPTAADWAEVCGTIGYEIVTRIGARVPRVYRHGLDAAGDGR